MPNKDIDGAGMINSATHTTAPHLSKQSRLNPLAMAFESPQKVAAATAGPVTVSNAPRAASTRMGPGEETRKKSRSPSKPKVVQRPVTAYDSPTKLSYSKEKFVRRIDGTKIGGSFPMSTRQQENNPNEIQRGWTSDKHRQERESKELAGSNPTSPWGGKMKVALNTEDWPSLPAARERSGTLE